jgi:hypothetical protein
MGFGGVLGEIELRLDGVALPTRWAPWPKLGLPAAKKGADYCPVKPSQTSQTQSNQSNPVKPVKPSQTSQTQSNQIKANQTKSNL